MWILWLKKCSRTSIPRTWMTWTPRWLKLSPISLHFTHFTVVVYRLIESSINCDYDRSVWFTILCFHVSILVRYLHILSRVPSVSYYIVKSESGSKSESLKCVFDWQTKMIAAHAPFLCCLVKMLSFGHSLRISK